MRRATATKRSLTRRSFAGTVIGVGGGLAPHPWVGVRALPHLKRTGDAMTLPLIERYRDRLPVTERTPVVSLGEGSTPLLRAPRLSERLGLDLWLKWEASNPTASYKDRGMTVAVSKAVEEGARAVICASTGNTSASAAAYAARAGIPALVLVAESAASGKLVQA